MFAHIPIDSDFTQGFFGAPPIVSNDRHKFAHVQNFDNAPAIFNFRGIHCFDFAIEDRARGHGGMQHPWQLSVNAILAIAHDDVWNVNARQ